MGLFDRFKKQESVAAIVVETQPNTHYLPVTGEVIPLDQIEDPVFGGGVLGPGYGIHPTEEVVYAPATGEIIQLADTKHAIAVSGEDGAEILMHVGMDTVDMNGDGFTPLVKLGDKVTCGQPILKFSLSKIKAAGHSTTIAVVVTNGDDFSSVELIKTGAADKLTPVVKTQK